MLYISAEMRPLELLKRITARETETFLGKLTSGELRPEASLALARRAAAPCGRLALVDACDAWAAPEWLREAARAGGPPTGGGPSC